MTEARKVRVIQGYGSEAGRFSFSEAEICLLPGGKEITLELGDGFIAKFTSPPSPPKLYTFAEAYAMMKAGKWMKCGETGTPQRFDGEHLVLGFSANKYSRNTSTFSPREIESQWQEATS